MHRLRSVNDVLVTHVDERELDLVVQALRQWLWLRQVREHLELGITLRFEHEFALAVDPFGRLDVDRERGPGQVVDRDQRVRLVLAEHQEPIRSTEGTEIALWTNSSMVGPRVPRKGLQAKISWIPWTTAHRLKKNSRDLQPFG